MAIKILSVDDELDMEMLIKQMFRPQIREKKYQFYFAHNGIEALEILRENNDISLILSDINMPGMDGLTFLTKVNDLKAPLLKAVMISAYGDMDNIRSAMNRGAFDFITKPIKFEDLEITVKKTIEHIEMLSRLQHEHDQLLAIQTDLNIAKDIQQSMLPKVSNPFIESKALDLHAFLEPAKSVGGDLFDYFMMDDERLFFIIGDVSDKGIPASLYMAITKAIFKSHFLNKNCGDFCDEVNQINTFLSSDNPSFMFVTAFVGLLYVKTGRVEYIDAGHEPPLIIRKGKGIEVLKKRGGLALSIDGTFTYKSQELFLEPGDTLFMYTDGATDANNSAGERFGLKRIEELIGSMDDTESPKVINDVVRQQLQEFIGSHYQFDDITVLTIRYMGSA
ncbi:SpoIIE family protein phosphatase [Nibrella saemangeumensis]|uniref:SpoIIE family protein phosphatase n=1 Tax=Nibrella saemangeumensis TaxID=1084526 RepID=A0ABP8NDA6_9BACT